MKLETSTQHVSSDVGLGAMLGSEEILPSASGLRPSCINRACLAQLITVRAQGQPKLREGGGTESYDRRPRQR